MANASHELRTPLTLQRAIDEVALADESADVAALRLTVQRLLEAGEREETLIEALLTLARSERGLDRTERVDLGDTVSEVLLEGEAAARQAAVRVRPVLSPVAVMGDSRLLGRLVTNLVDNAVRHNVPGGEVEVRVAPSAGGAVFVVSSPSGPAVQAYAVAGLLELFRRLEPERGVHDGLGLDLSIVAAIAPPMARPRRCVPGCRAAST